MKTVKELKQIIKECTKKIEDSKLDLKEFNKLKREQLKIIEKCRFFIPLIEALSEIDIIRQKESLGLKIKKHLLLKPDRRNYVTKKSFQKAEAWYKSELKNKKQQLDNLYFILS